MLLTVSDLAPSDLRHLFCSDPRLRSGVDAYRHAALTPASGDKVEDVSSGRRYHAGSLQRWAKHHHECRIVSIVSHFPYRSATFPSAANGKPAAQSGVVDRQRFASHNACSA